MKHIHTTFESFEENEKTPWEQRGFDSKEEWEASKRKHEESDSVRTRKSPEKKECEVCDDKVDGKFESKRYRKGSKRTNEELIPNTYLDAGSKLNNKGHKVRGKNLIDYGMEKIGSDGQFTFFVEGKPVIAKWDPDRKHFQEVVGTTNEEIGGGKYSSGYQKEAKDHVLIVPFYTSLVAYGPNIGAGGLRAYVKTRKEATELFQFLKSVGCIGQNNAVGQKMSVNDLYKDDADVEPVKPVVEPKKVSGWDKFKSHFISKDPLVPTPKKFRNYPTKLF